MTTLRLAELIAPLAVASDRAAGLPPETALRTALVGVGLGRACGLTGVALGEVYYAGLLRHLGCSTTSHEETLLMGDEQELRTSMATVDAASPVQMLKRVATGFARGKSRLKRAATVARFMARAPFEVPRIFGARCEVATQLGRRLGLGDGVVRALDEAYERFDGKGVPKRQARDSLSIVSRVLAVAETAATFMRLPGGEGLAGRILAERAGSQFDPTVVARFLAGTEAIVGPARADSLLGKVLEAEPAPLHTVASPHVHEVALVLADFVDLKSTFTLGHSRRVATVARQAAAISLALMAPSSMPSSWRASSTTSGESVSRTLSGQAGPARRGRARQGALPCAGDRAGAFGGGAVARPGPTPLVDRARDHRDEKLERCRQHSSPLCSRTQADSSCGAP